MQIDRVRFARQYLALARPHLEQVRLPQDTFTPSDERADLGVARATAALLQTKGGALCLSLAAQALRPLLDPATLAALSQELQEAHRSAYGPSLADPQLSADWERVCATVGVASSEPLRYPSPENSPATHLDRLYFPPRADAQFHNPTERVFALGHEAGHIRAGDSLGELGLLTLADCLEAVEEKYPEAVGQMGQALRASHQQRSHQEELAADQVGLQVVLAEGLDPGLAIAFLERQWGSDSHPDGSIRAEALRRALPRRS